MSSTPRTMEIKFRDAFRWSFDQEQAAGRNEHPVAQFRRLHAEVAARIDAALVAIHGEPPAADEREEEEPREEGIPTRAGARPVASHLLPAPPPAEMPRYWGSGVDAY